jgi:hypothetical protein
MEPPTKEVSVTGIVPRPGDPGGEHPRVGAVPLERVLFALAGTMALLSAGLAVAVTPWFLALTSFVALSQWSYAAFGDCPASLALRRLPCVSEGTPR